MAVGSIPRSSECKGGGGEGFNVDSEDMRSMVLGVLRRAS